MIKAQGEDFSIHVFKEGADHGAELIMNCKKCTWNVNLNMLDTLEDIELELEHHRDKCFYWSHHESTFS